MIEKHAQIEIKIDISTKFSSTHLSDNHAYSTTIIIHDLEVQQDVTTVQHQQSK